MTRYPLAQQRRLLQLQELDASLARLAHERSHLPVLSEIERTVQALRANKRDAVLAQAALAEAQQVATQREEEVAQVERRAAVLRERLASGGAAARDLTAIQGEIDQLGRRQAVLEEAQLEAIETLDNAQGRVDELGVQEQEIRSSGRELTARRDAEFARIDAQSQETGQRRDALAAQLDAGLVAAYDAARAATGGLGVVALYGRRVEGEAIELSPQELARIDQTDPDELVYADDVDVIIVRMED